MKQSKISAHYMVSPEGELLKWPVITVREDGLIIKTEFFPDGMREQAGVIFYSGILSPAFIDLFQDDAELHDDLTNRMLNRHFVDGTLVLAAGKTEGESRDQTPLPLVVNKPSDFISGKLENQLKASNSNSVTLLQKMKFAFAGIEGLKLSELLKMVTIEAAQKACISNIGSIEPGKYPGIILLQNTDLINLKFTPQTNVKWMSVPEKGMLLYNKV